MAEYRLISSFLISISAAFTDLKSILCLFIQNHRKLSLTIVDERRATKFDR